MPKSDWESQPLTIALPADWWLEIRDAIQRSGSPLRVPAVRRIETALQGHRGPGNVDVQGMAGNWREVLELILKHSQEGTYARNGGAVIAAGASAVKYSRELKTEE